jgi:hypothetical protein
MSGKSGCKGCVGAKAKASALTQKAAPVEQKRAVAVKAAPAEVKPLAVSPGGCSNEVAFCVSVEIPDCFSVYTPTFEATPGAFPTASAVIGTCHLECETVSSSTTVSTTVTNPCGGADFTCDATVSLDKIYVRGYAEIVAGVAVKSASPSDAVCGLGPDDLGNGFMYVSRAIQIPINDLVCVQCAGGANTCDTLFPLDGVSGTRSFVSSCAVTSATLVAGGYCGGQSIYTLTGTFILNSCPITP